MNYSEAQIPHVQGDYLGLEILVIVVVVVVDDIRIPASICDDRPGIRGK